MNVLDKDHVADDTSVVSGSTNMTDGTQSLQVPDLGRNPKIYYRLQDGDNYMMSQETDREIYTINADGSEMSPLVPMQVTKFKQMSPTIQDSSSEMSELLIPVISKKSSTTVKSACFETQESQMPEDSQSLLPQLPIRSCVSPGLTTNKTVESNSTRDQWIKGDNSNTIPPQCVISSAVILKENVVAENEAQTNSMAIKHAADLNDCSGMMGQQMKALDGQMDEWQNLGEHTITGEKSENLEGRQGQITSSALKSTEEQNRHEMLGQVQNDVSLSQSVKFPSGREGEISQSQGSVTLAATEKDPVDRIVSRLDRLVSSLDKVPKRRMMVMEAAVLQCITSLQDSLNNRLKKQTTAADTTGILRKLLQTTQNGLLKLTEQHKLQKSQLAQSGTQSTQQTYQSQWNQSAVNDLEKRQKRVFSLLKRQKYLVELYKTIKRPVSDKDVTVSPHPDNKIYEDTERRQYANRFKGGKDNKELGRMKTERMYTGKAPCADVLNKTTKPCIKKTSKERHIKSKINKGSSKETIPQCATVHSDIVNGETECNNVKPTIQSGGDQLDKYIQNADFGKSVISQDLTTVPDTQEFNTQNSSRVSAQDIFIDRDNLAAESICEDHVDEYNEKELEKNVNIEGKNDTELGKNVASGKDKGEISNLNDRENTCDREALNRDELEIFERNGDIKKPKLKEDECENDTLEKTLMNTKDKPKLSEVLWMNMLRDDTNKPVENTAGKEIVTQPEIFTAGKLNKLQEPSGKIKEAKLNISKGKGEFLFTKPISVSKPDLQEAKNTFALPKEQKKRETIVTGKTEKGNETRYDIIERKRKEIDDTEVHAANEKNALVIDGLSSPPNATIPGEIWHNVSPTATSMSSDVFMVKVKDLQKRMKRRAVLSESIHLEKLQPLNTIGKVEEIRVSGRSISDQDDVTEKLVRSSENIEIYTEDIVKVNDTISEAIDSVIKQSREIAAKNEDAAKGKFENTLQNSTQVYEIRPLDLQQKKSQPSCTSPQPGLPSSFDTHTWKKSCNKQRLTPGLPTLRDLVHCGQLIPGKAALSCNIEGKIHRASLTPLGKIRTLDGLIFTTVSQWVSTLTSGAPVKKKKAYKMVLYKGRQLLSFCQESPDSAKVQRKPSTIVLDLQPGVTKSSIDQSSVDQGVQVDSSELTSSLSKMSDDEKRLNMLLSNCFVRLLTEQDFVSCDDLPDNFWTEDFSKVQLHRDIWDTVDAW